VTGTAQLLFIGQEPTEQGGLTSLLTREYGRCSARFDPPHRARLSVDLTADGVALVAAALRAGGAPVAGVYRLTVEGLWPAERVIARVRWGRVHDHLSTHLKDGDLLGVDDVARLVEDLREDSSIVVQAVHSQTGEPAGGVDAALAWVQRELVQRFCEPVMPLSHAPAHVSLGTVGEVFGAGTVFAVKRLTQVETATAEVDFQRAAVVTRDYTVQAHLADVLGGADPAAHTVDAGLDHPFFSRFALHVQPAGPLPDLHLAEVAGTWAYGGTQLPVRLTPGAPEATVQAWADASPDRTWVLQAAVTFEPDAPIDPGRQVALPPLRGQGRELTVDLADLLGLVRIALTATADARVALTRVRLRHWRGGEQRAERDLVLAGDPPRAVAWLLDRGPGDRIDATVTYLLADGRVVHGLPFDVDSTEVVVPPAFPGALTVRLIADDAWTPAEGPAVQRVAVALQRHRDEPTTTVLLEQPGALAAVNLDLPDPTDRGYRYRTTRTFAGGRVVEDDWVDTDRPVLLIGATPGDRLVVDVTPVGKELPQAGVVMVEVELSYLDVPNQVRDQQKKIIRALADRPHWEVAIADPAHRGYEYRITTHRTSGQSSTGPWTACSDRILLIPIV
jgi:hypothetical protein